MLSPESGNLLNPLLYPLMFKVAIDIFKGLAP